jgi:hypothetical protein
MKMKKYSVAADKALLKGRMMRWKMERVHEAVYKVLIQFLKNVSLFFSLQIDRFANSAQVGAVLASTPAENNAHPIGITIVMDAPEDFKKRFPDNARLIEVGEIKDFIMGRTDLPAYGLAPDLAKSFGYVPASLEDANAEAGPLGTTGAAVMQGSGGRSVALFGENAEAGPSGTTQNDE